VTRRYGGHRGLSLRRFARAGRDDARWRQHGGMPAGLDGPSRGAARRRGASQPGRTSICHFAAQMTSVRFRPARHVAESRGARRVFTAEWQRAQLPIVRCVPNQRSAVWRCSLTARAPCYRLAWLAMAARRSIAPTCLWRVCDHRYSRPSPLVACRHCKSGKFPLPSEWVHYFPVDPRRAGDNQPPLR
jgi:hypothetical protein